MMLISNHTKKQAVYNVAITISGLVMRFSYVRNKSHAQIPDMRVEVQDLKVMAKLFSLFLCFYYF